MLLQPETDAEREYILKYRGGCLCSSSLPPCFACSDAISEEESEELAALREDDAKYQRELAASLNRGTW